LTKSAIDAPLVVDLDGTLLRSDLLVESAFAYIGARPLRLFNLARLMRGGKAALKAGIAAETDIDVGCLPYDERVLSLFRRRAPQEEGFISLRRATSVTSRPLPST
jgi:hypothetical protein